MGSPDESAPGLQVGATTIQPMPFLPTDSLKDKPPKETPKSDAKGKRYRLRLHVPTDHTTMTLGDHDDRHGHYNGFSVHTTGHVLFSATGTSVQKNRMTFESTGNMVLQSIDGSLFFGSKELTAIVAGEQMMVGAAKGVLIHGGHKNDMSLPKQDTRTGHVPDLAHGWHKAEENYHHVKSWWEVVDAFVCLGEFGLGILNAWAGRKKHMPWALGTPIAISAFGVGAGFFGAKYGKTGTVIHGDSGLLAGSPGFTSFYGGLSTTFGSFGGIFLGANWVELFAKHTAELVSFRNISVEANNVLEVMAKETFVLSSRTGKCHVDGKRISAGGLSKDGSQVETDSAVFGAEETVVVQGDDVVMAGKDVAAFAAKNVQITAEKTASVGSKEMVSFGVDRSQVVVKKGEVSFGMFSKGLAAPPSREAYPGKHSHHDFAKEVGECIEKRSKEAKSYCTDYSAPSPDGSLVKLTPTEVKVTCKGYSFTGGGIGWQFPNMKVLK